MWENKNLNLGKVKEYSSINIHFELLESKNYENIESVRPCCGSCTTIKSIDSQGIKAVFDVGEIPAHLNNVWEFNKCITIYYKDGNSEVLTFKGKVER